MTERTPLLVEQGLLTSSDLSQQINEVFPSLEQASVNLLHDQSLTLKHLHDLTLASSSEPPSLSHKHAFLFSVLLYIAAPTDEEDEETSQLHNMFDTTLQTLTAELWTSYSRVVVAEQRSGRSSSALAIRELLWTPLVVSSIEDTNEREFVTCMFTSP